MAPDAVERIERERSFHDERFSDDSARAAAGRFYDLVGAAHASYRRVLDAALPGSRALEYGAGTGGDGFELAERGVHVTGIDLSPVAVEAANAAARARGLPKERCAYHEMDAERLALPDDAFHLVFGSGILHHLDIDVALAEVRRVLHPDGAAVFFEPMGHNPAINLYRRLTPAMRSPDEHPLVAADFAVAARHFEHVDPQHHVLGTFAALPFRRWSGFPRLVERLDRADQAVFRRIPVLRRYGWIVVLHLARPRAAERAA
jgi:SAM-dependent methyltransferase